MNARKTVLRLVLALPILAHLPTLGQQEAQFTQYMYNTLAINPAYAGSRGGMSIAGLYRAQWVGLDGAPVTQTFTMHTPSANGLGFGLSVINDQIGNGTSQETYFDGAISYSITMGPSTKLNFGLKAGGHFLNVDFSKLENLNGSNPGQQTTIDNPFAPNFGVGVFLFSEAFYVGASAPNILETEYFDSTSTLLAKEKMNLYLIGGMVFDLSPNIRYKPAFLAKAVSGAPVQLDLSSNFMFFDKFILGAAYRLDAAWSGLAGFQLNKAMMLGLAYDREITELGGTAFTNGSFEVFLRFDFRNKTPFGNSDNVLTPRFF